MNLDALAKVLTELRLLVALIPDRLALAMIAILGVILIAVLVLKALPSLGQNARDDIVRFLVRYVFSAAGVICIVSFAWAIGTGRAETAQVDRGITKSEISEPGSPTRYVRLLGDSTERIAGQLVALSRRIDAPSGINDALVRLKEGDPKPVIAVIRNELLPTLHGKQERIEALGWIGVLGFYSDTQSAIKAYDEIVKLDPGNARAWAQLALLRDRRGLRTEAVDAAEKARDIATEMNDDDALSLARAALGAIALRKGDLQGARAYFEQARAPCKAADATATLGLARTYYTEGKYQMATGFYEEALNVFRKADNSRGTASASLGLADVAMEKRDSNAARGYYENALNQAEHSGDLDQQALAWSGLGRIYLHRRDFAKANETHLKALVLRQKLGDQLGASYAYNSLGDVADTQHRFQEATAHYLKAIELANGVSQFAVAVHNRGLGRVYFEQNDWSQALQAFDRALENDEMLMVAPYIALDKTWIGVLFRRLNRKQDACKEWKDAAQLYRDSGRGGDVGDVKGRMKELNCSS